MDEECIRTLAENSYKDNPAGYQGVKQTVAFVLGMGRQ